MFNNLKGPFEEIVSHIIISALAVIGIFLIEKLLEALHLQHRMVPIINITLEDWMFDLDVLSVTLIVLVGLVKALREMW